MEEWSGLTAAAAELGDTGRCKVDIAGALVSPLISAPRLELVLRGLPIVIYMILRVAGFQSSIGLCVAPRTHGFLGASLFCKVRMCLNLSDAAWHKSSGGIPPFPIDPVKNRDSTFLIISIWPHVQGCRSKLGSVSSE